MCVCALFRVRVCVNLCVGVGASVRGPLTGWADTALQANPPPFFRLPMTKVS